MVCTISLWHVARQNARWYQILHDGPLSEENARAHLSALQCYLRLPAREGGYDVSPLESQSWKNT